MSIERRTRNPNKKWKENVEEVKILAETREAVAGSPLLENLENVEKVSSRR